MDKIEEKRKELESACRHCNLLVCETCQIEREYEQTIENEKEA